MGTYSQAVEITNYKRLVFVSGQIPVSLDGSTPNNFSDQCDLTWKNVIAQLDDVNMGVKNLVKVNTFIASREHLDANRDIRNEHLGDHTPALSIVIAGIFDEEWLIEIEAIAAD